MRVLVLGTGCAKCDQLHATAQRAISLAGVEAELAKVETLEEIVKLGVAFTPGLVIDGEVKSQGSVPNLGQIVSWLTEAASAG
jgi:small redox-active disulfide protein 2